MKIILGFIAVVGLLAIGGAIGGTDDTSSTTDTAASSYSSDADRVVELTDEGLELLGWMTDWSEDGRTDPTTACELLPTAKDHMVRLAAIVSEIGQYDSVPADNLASLRTTHAELARNVSHVSSLCAEAGF